jgi:glycosyltransferase involved in cell wall biosynthesis
MNSITPKNFYIKTELKPSISITIFAVPKPFIGNIGIIQRNAITSWTLLEPRPEIILFGNEKGTEKIAKELGIRHLPKVKCNQYGTPLLDGIFAEVQRLANNKILTYINADIILTQDFLTTVQQVAAEFPQFLLTGRRWNLELQNALNLEDKNWVKNFKKLVWERGVLAPETAKDYFVFPKHLFSEVPEFAIGRGYWDNWMVNLALEKNYPVIDGSQTILAVHQNHSYSHVLGGKTEAHLGKEAEINQKIGKVNKPGNIGEATCQLKPSKFSDLPEVSLVIISQNGRGKTGEVVDSILSQNFADFEIIVIDDGGDEKTRKVLEPYFERLRYIPQKKKGISAAKNRALGIAKGEFIMFLEDDCYLLPGMLGEQVAAFEERSSIVDVLLSGWQRGEGEGAVKLEPWKLLPDLEDIHIWKFWQLWQPLRESAMMFRRDRLEMFGGFDPRLHPAAANVEVVLRMALLRGSKLAWLSEATCRCGEEKDDWENLTAMAADVELLVDCFFEGSLVPEWMRDLESRARYHVMVWLGWLMYEVGEKERMAEYLGRSLSYSPYQTRQTAVSWVQRFKKFAESSGGEFGERSALDLLLKYFDIAEGK